MSKLDFELWDKLSADGKLNIALTTLDAVTEALKEATDASNKVNLNWDELRQERDDANQNFTAEHACRVNVEDTLETLRGQVTAMLLRMSKTTADWRMVLGYDVANAIDAWITGGQKLAAIKDLKTAFNVRLLDAKNVIEARQVVLGKKVNPLDNDQVEDSNVGSPNYVPSYIKEGYDEP